MTRPSSSPLSTRIASTSQRVPAVSADPNDPLHIVQRNLRPRKRTSKGLIVDTNLVDIDLSSATIPQEPLTMSNAVAPPATTAVVIPLPLPSSKYAPNFTGRNVTQFLETIELLGKNAGCEIAEYPSLIKRFSSQKVRRTIVAEDVFKGQDWDKAKEKLIFYYGSNEKTYKATPKDLRSYSSKTRHRETVADRHALGAYIRKFALRTGNMVSKKVMTETERDYLFYRGFPPKTQKALLTIVTPVMALRNASPSRQTPPTMDESIAAARSYFNPNNIDYESSDSDGSKADSDESDDESDANSDSSRDLSESSDSDITTRKASKGRKEKRSRSRGRSSIKGTKKTAKRKAKPGEVTRKEVDEMTEKLDHLIAMQTSQGAYHGGPPAGFNPQGPTSHVFAGYRDPARGKFAGAPPYGGGSSLPYGNSAPFDGPRSCFMCGKEQGRDLEHALSLTSCPVTYDLINEGLIRFDTGGKLVRANGNELPRSPGPNTGGMAAVIRDDHRRNENRTLGPSQLRDPPPHQKSSVQSGQADCYAMGLCRDGKPVLSGRTYGLSTRTTYSFPVITRSKSSAPRTGGSDTESLRKQVRFDVHDRRESVTDGEAETDIPASSRLKPLFVPPGEPTKMTKIAQPAEDRAPYSAPHPTNTQDGWRIEEKKKRKDQRARVEEVPDIEYQRNTKTFRFTSKLQDTVSMEDIQEHLLDSTIVTLSLRQVLAVSPEMQRRFQGMVPTRREAASKSIAYTSRFAEVGLDDSVELPGDIVGNDKSEKRGGRPEAYVSYDKVSEDLGDILERYAAAVMLGAKKKHFAMSTGLIEGVFGNQKVRFLVDTGSELNLISRSTWEACKSLVDLDRDGKRC